MPEEKIFASWQRFLHQQPKLAPSVFVARTADVIGAVSVEEHSSIWFQTVIRADINEIVVGRRTNIQDGCILHVADDYSVQIGDDVTCGHRAVIHACHIGNRLLDHLPDCWAHAPTLPFFHRNRVRLSIQNHHFMA